MKLHCLQITRFLSCYWAHYREFAEFFWCSYRELHSLSTFCPHSWTSLHLLESHCSSREVKAWWRVHYSTKASQFPENSGIRMIKETSSFCLSALATAITLKVFHLIETLFSSTCCRTCGFTVEWPFQIDFGSLKRIEQSWALDPLLLQLFFVSGVNLSFSHFTHIYDEYGPFQDEQNKRSFQHVFVYSRPGIQLFCFQNMHRLDGFLFRWAGCWT